MIKKVGGNAYGVVEFILSSETEVDDLPKGGLVAQGSTAFVIENSSVYMYDEENDVWKAI